MPLHQRERGGGEERERRSKDKGWVAGVCMSEPANKNASVHARMRLHVWPRSRPSASLKLRDNAASVRFAYLCFRR